MTKLKGLNNYYRPHTRTQKNNRAPNYSDNFSIPALVYCDL